MLKAPKIRLPCRKYFFFLRIKRSGKSYLSRQFVAVKLAGSSFFVCSFYFSPPVFGSQIGCMLPTRLTYALFSHSLGHYFALNEQALNEVASKCWCISVAVFPVVLLVE